MYCFNHLKTALLAASLAITPALHAKDLDKHQADKPTTQNKTTTIVQVAKQAKSFNTLLAAVEAAGLTQTLSAKGPYTLFAPSDKAFSKIPPKTLQTLLHKDNKETLKEILLYHVVTEKLPANKVLKAKHLKTAANKNIHIKLKNKTPMINDAKILKTDILADNGIIHVIDTVLIPDKAIQDHKKKENEFKPFIEAPLPAGYPEPGPVDQIVIQSYPQARIAVAKQSKNWLGQNTSFMQLFRHIKKHNISMTAPVQQIQDPKTKKMKNMGFYYQNTNLGKLGQDKTVTVVDQKPQTYASIGVRGRTTKYAIQKAQDKLNQWLKQNKAYKNDGPTRVLSYNSPFVLPKNRFFEVQIPIASKADHKK